MTATHPESANRYHSIDVPVRGGELRVGIWEPANPAEGREPPTVLAIHGITASHRCWLSLADRLPGYRIVAPDLRGRGRSNELPGPYGMQQHAADVTAVLDFLELAQALVVGHSMGGFVAVTFTALHPDRVGALLLVDGGVPLPVPAGVDPAKAAAALMTSVSARLAMNFPNREAYREYFKAHPAFAGQWNDAVADYVDYDLVGDEPALHPATSTAAMSADSTDQNDGTALLRAWAHVPAGTIFLRAPRGFLDDEPGLWPPEALQDWRGSFPQLDVRGVGGVNHYTILFNEAGLSAVQEAVQESIERSSRWKH
jgi:lipase